MSNPGWADWAAVEKIDPEAAEAILAEVHRENSKIELIASENFSSPAVLAAFGTPLTNKYAEGYPGRRYYGGCEFVDVVENLAIDRAKEIFGADHVNVQPHAGAQANVAAYFAFLQPGRQASWAWSSRTAATSRTVRPSTSRASCSTSSPTACARPTSTIDYDEVRDIAHRERPKVIVAGATAYSRIWDFARLPRPSPTRSVRCSSWMRRTSSVSWRAACTPIPSSTPTWSLAPHTRLCAGPAAP